ncbi:MAG TPA: CHRD domain-containing protein [Acidimicrobiales bacterium]|jgi:hypothetical protein|nr:CHRD domain-containing protein [Acidimicrobiales bacterium]
MSFGKRWFAIVSALTVISSGTAVAALRYGDPLRPALTVNPEVAYTVALTGAAEVPGGTGDGDGSGSATVTVNSSTGLVCVSITTANIDPMTGLHIHPGAVGVEGGIVVDFAVTSGTSAGKCVTTTASQAAAINADPTSFYLNAHTAAFTDGAIRGQLAARGNDVGALNLLPEPLRAYDSRGDASGALPANGSRSVSLRSAVDGNGAVVDAVPPGARAAIVTLTVTQTVDGGYLTLFSNAIQGTPATSTVNWTATNSDVAATTTVLIDGSGSVKVTAGPRGTHFIIDVIGYYA